MDAPALVAAVSLLCDFLAFVRGSWGAWAILALFGLFVWRQARYPLDGGDHDV